MRGRELQDYLDLSAEELARLEEKKDSGYGSQGLIRVALKVVFTYSSRPSFNGIVCTAQIILKNY